MKPYRVPDPNAAADGHSARPGDGALDGFETFDATLSADARASWHDDALAGSESGDFVEAGPGASQAQAAGREAAGASTPQAFPLVVDEAGHGFGRPARPRIGEILVRAGKLRPADVEKVLSQQGFGGRTRFGELVIAGRYASMSDVLWALSQQSELAGASAVTADAQALPTNPELVIATQPHGAAAEVIRNLRAHLLSGIVDMTPVRGTALALVSPDEGDGKSFLAANLALSLAQQGYPTMLVEADLRKPRLARVFDIDPAAGGLSEVLHGKLLLGSTVQSLRAVPNLFVLTAGAAQANPAELLQRPAMSLLLSSLRSQFPFVIVDTPSFGVGADAALVSEHCGAALVVARTGQSRLDRLKAMVDRLRHAGVTLAGTVMNAH